MKEEENSPIMIRFDSVSKQYRLGVVGRATLNEDFKRFVYRLLGKPDPFLMVGESNDRNVSGSSNYVWVLRDISFEVKKGEVLGIIGRNGAGKSTLLKILSKVTGPTGGRLDFNGRIGALLEVGTGFNPELTGRENVYLNGAILGMSKREIREKMDDIVEFSGCARYIDTPVKRYSSGMKVRLGFAVAAHLEPDILVVDEVLAVGDADFQKKAVGKMKDIASEDGRTVLFVSHNMSAIERLCDRVVVLEQGMVKGIGQPSEMIDLYLNSRRSLGSIPLSDRKDRRGTGAVRFSRIEILRNGQVVETLKTGESCEVKIYFEKKLPDFDLSDARINLTISKDEKNLIVFSTQMTEGRMIDLNGSHWISFKIPNLPLSKAHYLMSLYLESHGLAVDWVTEAADFTVEGGDFYGHGVNCPKGWEGHTVLTDFKTTVDSESHAS